MPLKWERGINPYVHTHFAKLQLGPRINRQVVNQKVKNLVELFRHNKAPELGGKPLREQAISEAGGKLQTADGLIHELLLMHPLPDGGTKPKNQKQLASEINKVELPEADSSLPLRHPLAIFWFTPAPPAHLALPPWESLGIVDASSDEDRRLDVVFDS